MVIEVMYQSFAIRNAAISLPQLIQWSGLTDSTEAAKTPHSEGRLSVAVGDWLVVAGACGQPKAAPMAHSAISFILTSCSADEKLNTPDIQRLGGILSSKLRTI